MSKQTTPDENDRLRAGTLPTDPRADTVPLTKKAQDEPRVYTVRELLYLAHVRGTTRRERQDIITTGHWEIDRDTGGFRKGFVTVFGAKSSWGKSSSLIMFADENIKRGKRILIVSSEDPKELYGERLMIRRARVDKYRFDLGCLNADEIDRVTAVAARGEDVPVYLSANGRSIEWAAKQVKKLIATESIDLVAWDYLHSFVKDKNIQDPTQALNYVAGMMTAATKDAGIAGIIYGQVTPDDKATVPDMYSIRYSKDVVNAADVVMIGFVPTTKLERDQDGQRVAVVDVGDRALVLAKNKPGPGPKDRVYRLGSDTKHQCFDVVLSPDEAVDRWADEALGARSRSGDFEFDSFEDESR